MGPPAPEGCVGQVWEGTSPRWAGAPPHQGPRRMGEWEGANPRSRWALRPTLVAPPLSSPWPPPWMGSGAGRLLLGVETLRGAQPPPPLYIVEVWAAQDTRERLSFGAALPLSLLLLPVCAWRSPAGSRYFHHHAVVLLDLHQPLLPPCWIKKEDTSLLRTCMNAEVPSVRR